MKKSLTPQQQNLNIDITKTVPYVCDNPECDNEVFMSVMKFRKVPKLLTGSTEDQLIPVTVFMCTSCGNIPKDFDLNV